MAEYRYYLIPDAMTRAFPEQFGKQTPTEFFDNIADLEKRYHQLREMPYNNERTWNERAGFPYARLVVGIDRQNPDGAVAIIQVRNGVNYLCDDYRGPYADGSDAQIPQMAKKLVEVIGADRVRPHTFTQRDGYTWVQVEKDMHITEWLYAHELCSSLKFTRFLNRDGRELFQVRDGQRVIETNADGTKRIRAVKNIDVTHAYVGHYGCHVQQYADANYKSGCYVTPEHPQPGDNLDKLQIYQITKGGCEYRFMNYAYSKSRIHAADYSSVYIANLPADYDLDRCFQEFNAHVFATWGLLLRRICKTRELHLSRQPQPKKGLRGMCWRVGSCSVKWEQSLQKLIFLRKTGIQSRQPLRRQIAFTFQEAIRSSLWMRCENQEQTNC